MFGFNFIADKSHLREKSVFLIDKGGVLASHTVKITINAVFYGIYEDLAD